MGSEGVSVKTEDACEGSNPTARLPIVNDQENCLAGEPLLEDSLPLTVLRNNHQAYGDLDLKTSLANEQERQQLPTHVSGGLQHNSEQQLPVVQPPTAGTTHEQGTLFHTSFGLEGAAPHTGAGGFPHPMHTLPHHGKISNLSLQIFGLLPMLLLHFDRRGKVYSADCVQISNHKQQFSLEFSML